MSRLLKKSFDPAKCKTLLQLASQKLKILRNKHAIAVKTLRADVARLLEKGQDSSAKTQVDNVFREEKIVLLYNILEQFCQLVISRLESMKSQKECPPDLKEAVASFIYAAPRCEEIEELKKVSSYLKKKYGTEFSLAAKELRSGCGVNTQIIQNLSSLPLGYDARMRLLKDIAAENNIKWEDETNADTSKQPAGLLDGPRHFPSGTQVSDGRNLDKQKSASMSMHTNEVNGRATWVLKNSFSSHTQSPKTSLDSPLHNMHQPEKTNPNSTTAGVCSSSEATSSLDPYALARLQGRMDYKCVSDYMQREHKLEEHFDSTASINIAECDGHLTYPTSNNLHEKQMSNAEELEVESQLLDLEAATKIALASASEAVEAARDAVAMVRKDSLGRTKSRLPNIKQPAGRLSQSTSVPVHHEVSSDPIGESSSIMPESRFAPTWDNSDSDVVNHASEDTSGDLLKYVVFEESSDSQQWSSQVQDLATMKGESERLRLSEVPTSPSMDDFYRIDAKEKEEAWKTSTGHKQDGLFTKMDIQQDKTVQNVSSVPQFDDYSGDDPIEEDILHHRSTNASCKKQDESIFDDLEVQQDKGMQNESSVPQYDDVNSEEEIPFYLKGRAAIVKEDFSDEVARTPSHNLMTTSHLTDGLREESLGLDVQGTGEEPSLSVDSTEEPSNSSISRGRRAFVEESLIHSHEHAESVCSSSQSLKTSPRSEIDFVSGRSGIEISLLDSRYDKVPSLVSSSSGFPGYEDGDPSRHVRRNLNWGSTISEELDLRFDKTDEAYEPSLRSPNPSVDLEERTRAFKPDFGPSTQGIQSSPRKYQGMSRRSLRSTRPRPQDVPSPTT